MQTIIQDVQQLIADIEAKNWLAVAKDFAKLIQDVTGGIAGTITDAHPDLVTLKAKLHDLNIAATNAMVTSSHPILSQLLAALIAALPTIIQILTKGAAE